MTGRISRRIVLSWMAGAVWAARSRALAEEEKPSDRGIGGTGISSEPDTRIGARIGFIGTIQRFGSIYVNDDRITYPKDVAVWVNGERKDVAALAIGQVVRTVARAEKGGRLVADEIEMLSEVIGPIASVGDRAIAVLGQTVLLGDTPPPSWWQPGVRLSVCGIRTVEGAIVATQIAPAGHLPDQIVGVPVLHGWNLRIGALPLLGIAGHYAGWRVVVRGTPSPAGLVVTRVRPDAPFAGKSVDRLSIETFIERRGSDFHSGTGIAFRDVRLDRDVRAGGNVRAVLGLDVERSGALRLDRLRLEGGLRAMPRSLGTHFGNVQVDPSSGVITGSGPGNGALRGAVGLGGGPGSAGPAGGAGAFGPSGDKPSAGGNWGNPGSPGGGGNWGPGSGFRGNFDGGDGGHFGRR